MQLKGEDDVFVVVAELTDEALGLAQLENEEEWKSLWLRDHPHTRPRSRLHNKTGARQRRRGRRRGKHAFQRSNDGALAHHTAGHVGGTQFEQVSQTGGQFTAAHAAEVVEGEEMQVLCQVSWEAVKLVQHTAGGDANTRACTRGAVSIPKSMSLTGSSLVVDIPQSGKTHRFMRSRRLRCKPSHANKAIDDHARTHTAQSPNCLLFSEAARLEEVFHVEELDSQDL